MTGPAFVLHDHRRPRPHYDLRLEEAGVLRSWAVPKGLPQDSGHNRLAVQVGDHDLDHLTYTDDHKFIADIGWWEEHDRTERRLLFTLMAAAERVGLRPDQCRGRLAHPPHQGPTRSRQRRLLSSGRSQAALPCLSPPPAS